MSIFDLLTGRNRQKVRQPRRTTLHLEQLGGRILPGAVPYPQPDPPPPPPDIDTTDGGSDSDSSDSTGDSGSSSP